MELKPLLTELGKHLGVDGLALDENGICRLVFDKTLIVDLEPSPDMATLHAYGVAASIPAEGKERFYRRLLAANFFGQDTGPARFAIDEQGNEALLMREFDLQQTEFADFVKDLEDLVNRLEGWRERLAHSGPEGEAASPALRGSSLGGPAIRV